MKIVKKIGGLLVIFFLMAFLFLITYNLYLDETVTEPVRREEIRQQHLAKAESFLQKFGIHVTLTDEKTEEMGKIKEWALKKIQAKYPDYNIEITGFFRTGNNTYSFTFQAEKEKDIQTGYGQVDFNTNEWEATFSND